jgi:anti-anti-sigma factor
MGVSAGSDRDSAHDLFGPRPHHNAMDLRFPTFHVETERLDTEVHVRPIGELDLSTTPILEQAIADVADHPGDVVIDLRALEFIDSTGIHVLMKTRNQCAESGRGFSLIAGPPAIQRVFELTGLADRLPFR